MQPEEVNLNPKGEKQKYLLFSLALLVIIMVSLMTLFLFSRNNYTCKPGQSSDYEKAICLAQVLYQQQVSQGGDLSTGPCLSNDLLPGWVADLVHNPRQPVDDLPANQCQAFIEGRANHFVEIDLSGKVVRVE